MNCYNQTEMFRDLVKNKLIPFFPNVGMQKDMLSQKEQKLWQTFYSFPLTFLILVSWNNSILLNYIIE